MRLARPRFDTGQSGARISLVVGKSGHTLVHKLPGSSGAANLQKQVQLLRELKTQPDLEKFIPTVEASFPDGSYTLPFFQGFSLGEFLGFSGPDGRDLVGSILQEILATSSDPSCDVDFIGLEEKLEKLAERLTELPIGASRKAWLAQKIEIVGKILLSRDVFVPEKTPHGDFSLDNILVSSDGSQILLIDPNPSIIKSRVVDRARIRLDLIHGWWKSGFSESGLFRINRLALYRQISRAWEDGTYLAALTAYFALRIIPYTTNPVRLALLYNAINRETEEY